MHIKAVMFDFIGTTIMENDSSVITRCFSSAFNDHGVKVEAEVIKANRGREKKEMIEEVLSEKGFGRHLTQPILRSFRIYLQNNLDSFRLNEGANDILHYLRERKIPVGIGTGLPRDIFEAILAHVGWTTATFDYTGIAEEIGKSRPDPAMLLDIMGKLRIQNNELLKVGDTVADIREGKNAKVLTAAILSGTQDEKELVDAKPDFIVRSLMELRQIIN